MSGEGIEAIGRQLRLNAPDDTTRIDSGLDGIENIEDPFDSSMTIGFSDALASAVDDAATRGHNAYEMMQDFAAGRLDDLHGTMIASEQAGISTKLVGSIRDKLLQSFQELWRINV